MNVDVPGSEDKHTDSVATSHVWVSYCPLRAWNAVCVEGEQTGIFIRLFISFSLFAILLLIIALDTNK